MSADNFLGGWADGADQRVRTVVAPVNLPWLGAHVLYLEEFLHDDPEKPRRQLLALLEPDAPPGHGVRAHLYTFINPGRWVHLNHRLQLLASLGREALADTTGCDLVLTREAGQFRGGTVGRHCMATDPGGAGYLDYRLAIGEDLYWYRRRLLGQTDDELQEEVIGFNWFELNETRWFTCRIDWSAAGRPADFKPVTRLELHDQGGRGRFMTPDGRHLELALHSEDWPYAVDREALLLLVQEEGTDVPFGTSWAPLDAGSISLKLNWLRVSCGTLVPETDDLQSFNDGYPPRVARYPSEAPG